VYALASTATFQAAYSDFYDNGDEPFAGGVDAGTNAQVDPLHVDTSAAASLAWDLHLDTASPLIDAGDPSIQDADGSPSDISAYGGPGGGDW
jgi:hypothetical protein